MNNVEFLWGENLSDTTPAINQGQILFDKTTSTLHIDTEDGRQKVFDDTKNDLFVDVAVSDNTTIMNFVYQDNNLYLGTAANFNMNNDTGLIMTVGQNDALYVDGQGSYRVMFNIQELALSGQSKISGLWTDSIQNDQDATNKEYVDNCTSWIEW